MEDRSPLQDAAGRIEVALDDLGRVASAARHGDQLVAVIVDAHTAGFRRVLAVASDPSVLTDDPELGEVLWVHAAAGDGAAIDTMGTRVDVLRGAIEQCGVPGLAAAADELIDVVTGLHGWALERAVELLHDSGQHDAVLRAALDDELVAALLLAHGMYPEPLADRVERVLVACRTTLGPAGGEVALVAASDAEARVRLVISGGDVTQRWRTRLTVERALRELVADIVDLQIDGADAEPRGTPAPTIIPLTSIGRRRSARWTELPAAAALAPGDVVQLVHEGRKLVACRLGDDVYVAPDPFTTNEADPFARSGTRSAHTLRIVATDPPTVESGDGSRLVLSDPYPTHIDGGVLEVLL